MRTSVPGLALMLLGLAAIPAAAVPTDGIPAVRGSAAAQDSAAVPDSVPGQDSVGPDGAPAADADLEPLQPSQEAEDERIRSELQAVFDRVPSLSGIDVAVGAGVVTLTGEVPDSDAETRAVELAQSFEGVVYVDGESLANVAATDRLETVWSRLQEKMRNGLALLPLLGVAILIVIVFSLVARVVGARGAARLFPRMNPFVLGMLQRLFQFVLVVIGLVIALDLLDATALVGAVVGTAGLAGLALGFAFKDIAENYLAGVILSFRHPFEKNDWIVVGSHEGKVVRLTGRETILMTLDGNHVQIPNAIVFREPMLNYSRNPRRRFAVELGVAANSVVSTALDAGIEVLRGMQGVEEDPKPSGFVWGFGDSTIVLRFFGWVDQRNADWWRVRSEAMRLVKLGLEDAGVVLPAPEYIVHVPEGARVDLPPEKGGAARPPAPPAEESAAQRDVSVDLAIDEQIAEDRRSAGEEDLLGGADTQEAPAP